MNRNCLANEASSSTGYSLLKQKKSSLMCYSPNSESIGYRIDWTVGTSSTFHNFFWNLRLLLPLGTYLEPPCSSQKLRWNFPEPPHNSPPPTPEPDCLQPHSNLLLGKNCDFTSNENPVYSMNPNPGPKHGQLCKFSLSKSLGKEFRQQPSQTTKRRKRPPKIATPYRSERKCKFRRLNKPSGGRKDTFSIALSSKGTFFFKKK